MHRLRGPEDIALGRALAPHHALEQVHLVDDQQGITCVARVDRHLRDAKVCHALGDVGDRLAAPRKLNLPRLELEQLPHRAQTLLGAEIAHVAHPLVVEALAEVAITRIGNDHDDDLAGTQAAGDIKGAVHRGTGGAARKDSLATGQLARGDERVLVRYLDHLVDDREVQGPDHEVMADPLDTVDPGLANLALIECVVVHAADRVGARDEQRATRLGGLLPQVLRRTRDGAPGADPAHKGVDLAVGLLPNLGTGGQVVGLGVVHVVVLVGVEAARCFRCDALGDLHVAFWVIVRQVGTGDDDLGAVRLEHVDLLLAHLVRHRADAPVPAHRCRHREPEAGVARSALHQRRSRPEQVCLLCPANHVPGHSVLDRSRGVVLLKLGQHRRHARIDHAIQLDQRCVADEIENGLGVLHAWNSPPATVPDNCGVQILPDAAPT